MSFLKTKRLGRTQTDRQTKCGENALMFFFQLVGLRKVSMIKNTGLFFIVFCLLLTPSRSAAGSFKVSPVKINLNSRTKTTVINITNNSNENVTVQLEAKEWSQNETGTDTYQETEDIVFFPKIVTIEKRGERIIRVGYQSKTKATAEKTYRLFIEELPITAQSETALKLALTLAVPIFISPLKEIKKPSIENIKFSQGALSVKIKNSGNTHFIVGKITAIGLDRLDKEVFRTDDSGWYVLAGATGTFGVEIPEKDCTKTDKVKVAVEVERTIMTGDLILHKAQCVNKNESGKIIDGQLSK
jgi:fimbrial chaperone protein